MAGSSFNRVILVGNLTRDPEVRYTPKGTAIAKVGLAVNRTWRNEAGETKEETTFVDIDIFGRTAETVGQYLRKGRQILVEGRLRMDTWDDKQTGQKRSKLTVVADSVQFLGRPQGEEAGGGGSRPPAATAAAAAAAPAASAAPSPDPAPAEPEAASQDEDDVPF